MEQRSLRVISTNKNFFSKLTNTISKLLIPTKLGINGIMISIKRTSLIKAFEAYKNEEKDEAKKEMLSKKYEDAYTLYLEAIDKYIMDSIYKKVKNGTATEFEKDALSNYYEVIHLKQTEYLEYKYKKQQYLLQLDYQTLKSEENKIIARYEKFYSLKIEQLYKGILKHYSIQLADNLTYQDKNIIYDKIFNLLEDYITDVLPIKLKLDDKNMYKNIIAQYEKFDRFTVGKLDIKDTIEKRMILLGISRQLFTHSLPLVVAEQCYVKILKDLREIIITTKIENKKEAAYKLLIELIEDYKEELKLPKDYEMKNISYEDIMKVLSKATVRNKRIIYFEILGLALIDGDYEAREIELLEKIEKDLNIERARRIAISNYFFIFTEIYNFSVVDADSKIDLLREQAEIILG